MPWWRLCRSGITGHSWTGQCETASPGRWRRLSRGTPSQPANQRKASSLGSQRETNDLLIIAGIDTAVGKGWVRPDDGPTRHVVRRLQDVGAARLLIALRRQPGDDEVSLFREQKDTIIVPYQK